MIRRVDGLHLLDPADLPIALGTAFGTVGGRGPVVEDQLAFLAEVTVPAAAAVAEIAGVGDHQTLGVDPQRLDVVGAGEVMLVLPREHAAVTDATRRELQTGDVVVQVDEMATEVGHRAVGVVEVAIPAGIDARIERPLGRVEQEFVPVYVGLLDLLEEAVPVGLVAVAALLDPRSPSQHAGFPDLAAAGAGGEAANLRSDLHDDAGGLDRIDCAEQFRHAAGHRFLDVRVLLDFRGGLQLCGVMVVGRSDQNRVDVGAGHDVAVTHELLDVAAVPFLTVGGRLLPCDAPGVGDGDILDVLGLVVLVHAHHMRAKTATAAADLGQADALVGVQDAPVAAGGQRDGRGAQGGGLQKRPAVVVRVHGGSPPRLVTRRSMLIRGTRRLSDRGCESVPTLGPNHARRTRLRLRGCCCKGTTPQFLRRAD